MTTLEKVNFHGWPNCYRLGNKEIEMIVTTDVGPRISWWGFKGGANEFAEYPEHGMTGGDEWRIYGGHRLWHAPENKPRTYFPDNFPVKLKEQKGFIRITQPTETTTGIQKEIDIAMSDDKNQVKITHRLINQNLWTVELAVWALSVMTTGGIGILPIPARGSHTDHLLPTNSLTLWAYTNMSDPRWTWGEKYILLRQDPKATVPQKVGMMNTDGWAAYANHNNLFVKTFKFIEGATYPDFGCSLESFTNNEMFELETVSPMVRLEPKAKIEHVENWYLFRDVPAPKNDADVEKNILPKVSSI
jgi:hypothetical protein